MTAMLSFFVSGVPQPQGSKTAFVRGGKAVLVEGRRAKARKAFAEWRAAVAATAQRAVEHHGIGDYPVPSDVPLVIELCFVMPRPKSHRGAEGGIKDRYMRAAKKSKPDADKLLRAVCDAVTGVICEDDAQFVGMMVRKRYEAGEDTGVEVAIARGCHNGHRLLAGDCSCNDVVADRVADDVLGAAAVATSAKPRVKRWVVELVAYPPLYAADGRGETTIRRYEASRYGSKRAAKIRLGFERKRNDWPDARVIEVQE